MSITDIAKYAKIKGLNLVGTGDFTHPMWLKEIRDVLTPDQDTDLLKPQGESPVRFMLQTEICTIFDYEGDSKKIHHAIL
ncbi:MAG TPA: hypothetical protein VLH35_03460, partial [Candidatus Acidoferrales bacterium]|nr:hypothetical protein [Candidatus Acidoferrales bacterium]